jgi:hypothetical protein
LARNPYSIATGRRRCLAGQVRIRQATLQRIGDRIGLAQRRDMFGKLGRRRVAGERKRGPSIRRVLPRTAEMHLTIVPVRCSEA